MGLLPRSPCQPFQLRMPLSNNHHQSPKGSGQKVAKVQFQASPEARQPPGLLPGMPYPLLKIDKVCFADSQGSREFTVNLESDSGSSPL